MADKKNISLDDTVDKWSDKRDKAKAEEEAANTAYDESAWGSFSGSSPVDLLESLGYVSHQQDDVSDEPDEQIPESDEQDEQDVPDTSVPDDITDEDLDIDVPEQSQTSVNQTVQSGVVEKTLEERQAEYQRLHEERMLKDKKEDVSSEPDVSADSEKKLTAADLQKMTGSSKQYDIYEEKIGYGPENIAKPFDVVKTAINVSKKAQRDVKRVSGQSSRSSSKKASEGKEETVVGNLKDQCPKSHIRNVPRPLVDYIMCRFKGNATNQTDALIAWIVCNGDEDLVMNIAPYLTEAQINLVKLWENTPDRSMQLKLDNIVKRLQQMSFSIDTLEMLLCHSAFDKLGFRQEQPVSTRNINFMENGVLDVVLRAEEQTKQMRNERNIQQGRPKK